LGIYGKLHQVIAQIKVIINNPSHKPYTFAIRSKKPTAQGKISKEYVFANAISRTENKVRKHNNGYT